MVYREKKVPIEIWDSTNNFYMQFVRTCEMITHNLTRREARWMSPPFIAHPNSWIKCTEPIHAPQAYAMVHAQLLANDLCNRIMSKYL